MIGPAGSPSARWSSAAAALPEILLLSLGLETAPDIDSSPIPAGVWSIDGIRRLQQAIQERFGVVLGDSINERVNTFADVAIAVQMAIDRRISSE
jgi:hypothetical protein